MSTPQPYGDTALDRVAGALASEAARTELYRYATGVADAMPPDASSWYVVGAVVQVNAITRNELTTLADESKKGGTILAGLNMLVKWLPGFGRSALAAAGCACIAGCALILWLWTNAFNAGWGANDAARLYPQTNLHIVDRRAPPACTCPQSRRRQCNAAPDDWTRLRLLTNRTPQTRQAVSAAAPSVGRVNQHSRGHQGPLRSASGRP